MPNIRRKSNIGSSRLFGKDIKIPELQRNSGVFIICSIFAEFDPMSALKVLACPCSSLLLCSFLPTGVEYADFAKYGKCGIIIKKRCNSKTCTFGWQQ